MRLLVAWDSSQEGEENQPMYVLSPVIRMVFVKSLCLHTENIKLIISMITLHAYHGPGTIISHTISFLIF